MCGGRSAARGRASRNRSGSAKRSAELIRQSGRSARTTARTRSAVLRLCSRRSSGGSAIADSCSAIGSGSSLSSTSWRSTWRRRPTNSATARSSARISARTPVGRVEGGAPSTTMAVRQSTGVWSRVEARLKRRREQNASAQRAHLERLKKAGKSRTRTPSRRARRLRQPSS
jgi:hypothetical protein